MSRSHDIQFAEAAASASGRVVQFAEAVESPERRLRGDRFSTVASLPEEAFPAKKQA